MISGKKVFITGGAGFIANVLMQRLVEHNEIVVYDNFWRDTLTGSWLAGHPNITVVRGDVLDYDAVFDAMEQADWHVYQVLTKRSSLMRNYVGKRYDGGPVPRHIWLGVSVEDAAHASRIEHLKQINSDARFISFEPLLGPVGDVDLQGVAWAIVGGESGPRARPMDESWVRQIRDICERDDVAFFFKQWGGARPKSGGRLLDGEEWNGFPRGSSP